MNSAQIFAFFGMPALLLMTGAAVYFITGRLDRAEEGRGKSATRHAAH